jgi:type II secretory pathway pseudopilin PulG
MGLQGQGGDDRGYAMAALLVALAVMAVMMSVALPVWRHDAQREKEEELIFRGQQYVRAIRLFQQKTNTLPTRVDDLVQQHFLRKRYKDPITKDDFEWISAANPNPGGVQGSSLPGGRGTPQTMSGGPPASTGRLGANSASSSGFGDSVPGGMLGVRSKSKDESIRLFLNRNHYNEWMFVFQGLGAGGGRGGVPGGGRGVRMGPDGRPIGPNGQPIGGPPGGGVRIGPNGLPIGPNGQPLNGPGGGGPGSPGGAGGPTGPGGPGGPITFPPRPRGGGGQ